MKLYGDKGSETMEGTGCSHPRGNQVDGEDSGDLCALGAFHRAGCRGKIGTVMVMILLSRCLDWGVWVHPVLFGWILLRAFLGV